MTTQAAALIWCPFPDRDTARNIAKTLLDERHIACANILPRVASIYVWQDEIGEAEEAGALLKTGAEKLDAAVARLAQLHPYDAPAIVGWRCDAAAPATLAWLGSLGQ